MGTTTTTSPRWKFRTSSPTSIILAMPSWKTGRGRRSLRICGGREQLTYLKISVADSCKHNSQKNASFRKLRYLFAAFPHLIGTYNFEYSRLDRGRYGSFTRRFFDGFDPLNQNDVHPLREDWKEFNIFEMPRDFLSTCREEIMNEMRIRLFATFLF